MILGMLLDRLDMLDGLDLVSNHPGGFLPPSLRKPPTSYTNLVVRPMNNSKQWVKGAVIGKGRFGPVYIAVDGSNGQLMAARQMKLPTPGESDAEQEERNGKLLEICEREVEVLASLQHDNIRQYLGECPITFARRMILEKTSLEQAQPGTRNTPTSSSITSPVLHGLAYLHALGLVHAGLRSAHIYVDNKGGIQLCGPRTLTAVDPGLADTPTESVFWTAPEVIRGGAEQWTSSADIWGLGCTLVEMLTAVRPYPQFTPAQAISEIGIATGAFAQPTIPSDISSEAQDFLRWTLGRDSASPDGRPSAVELLKHPWTHRVSEI
ncbi:kinase-like domain-containing protein [Mycena epipterygia]|nr:kinase-like domain-containing protein [Mycena epipterygia]